jgi:hypothetical protein
VTRRRRTIVAALAVASIGLLGSCTSSPSARTQARDVVESLDLTQAEQTCMLEQIDLMTKDEVEALGDANLNQPIVDLDSGNADLQAFMQSLDDCRAAS